MRDFLYLNIMIQVIYKDTDLRYIFLTSDDPREMLLLEDYLNKIPQYQFLPSFRGIPKPEVFLNPKYSWINLIPKTVD